MRTPVSYGIALLLLTSMLACERRAAETSDSSVAPAEPTELPAPETWTVDPEGIGRVRTGITVAALGETLGTAVTPVYDFNAGARAWSYHE